MKPGQFDNPNPEPHKETNAIVPFEQSLKIASSLFEKHRDEILPRYYYKSQFGGGFNKSDREQHKQIDDFLKEIDNEILGKFQGHGITKGPGGDLHLAAFINAIQNNTFKGDCGQLRGGYIAAYTNADFLIVSHHGQPLYEVDPARNDRPAPKRNELGTLLNAGAFVVNDSFYPVVEELKSMFPNANIIRADELPGYIAEESGLLSWEEPSFPERSDEEDFEKYLQDLKLTESDLKDKSILDVGVGSSAFVKYVKDHNISDKVFGVTKDENESDIDFDSNIQERSRTVYALAEEMPFPDETFDLVVSLHATPNQYVDNLPGSDTKEDMEDFKKLIKKYVLELVRVTKKDGMIKLGGLFTEDADVDEDSFIYKAQEAQRLVFNTFKQILSEIAEQKGFTFTIDEGLCVIKPESLTTGRWSS